MSERPIKRRFKFSLLAVFWVVTMAACACGATLALLNQQALLSAVLALLGGTVWILPEFLKIEQEIRRLDPKQPRFLQRLMAMTRGSRR
jgi:hypothetical protein